MGHCGCEICSIDKAEQYNTLVDALQTSKLEPNIEANQDSSTAAAESAKDSWTLCNRR